MYIVCKVLCFIKSRISLPEGISIWMLILIIDEILKWVGMSHEISSYYGSRE